MPRCAATESCAFLDAHQNEQNNENKQNEQREQSKPFVFLIKYKNKISSVNFIHQSMA